MPRIRATSLPPPPPSHTYTDVEPIPISMLESVTVNPTMNTILDADRAPYAFDPTPRLPYPVAPPAPPLSRSTRQQHREGMGRPTVQMQPPPAAPVSTVHPSLFTPLVPSDDQAEKLHVLKEAAQVFANVLDVVLPISVDRIEMFNRLRELMFWAREDILRHLDGEPRPPAGDYTPFGADPTVAPSRQPLSARPGDRYMDPVTFEIRIAE